MSNLSRIEEAQNLSWMKEAACKGLTELFFPDKGDFEMAARAKAICADCPVIEPCLDYALHTGTATSGQRVEGIWGGQSFKQRERMRSQMGIRYEQVIAPCGTWSAVRRHYKRGEQLDDACQKALVRWGKSHPGRGWRDAVQ